MSSKAETLRTFIVDFLRKELEGPDPDVRNRYSAVQINGEELLNSNNPPRQRYGTAVLFPQKSNHKEQAIGDQTAAQIESTEEDDPDDDTDVQTSRTEDDDTLVDADDQTEQEVSLANEYLPSAMGLSALIQLPETLVVKVDTARYDQEEFPSSSDKSKTKYWARSPLSKEIEFSKIDLEKLQTEKQVYGLDKDSGLHVHIVSRPHNNHNAERLITVTLVNRNVCSDGHPANEDCFFQCKLSVYARNNTAMFLPYPDKRLDKSDRDAAKLQLLYRNKRVYAVGHGCGPDWNEETEGRSDKIWSDFLPSYEIKPIKPRPDLPDVELSMNMLSKAKKNDVLRSCRSLAEQYEKWLDSQEQRIGTLDHEYVDAAKQNLIECNDCLNRIESGINELNKNDTAFRAFQLMNQAMLLQQKHYKLSSENTRDWEKNKNTGQLQPEQDFSPPDYDDNSVCWYPFQLAFILMNIRSIVDKECDERSIVDTIWFPTGGGKTEAYLGLSAFTLFFRRLTDPSNAGTTVLMRYTLRLLTTQQFQRACSLIASCERIRRLEGSKILGTEPFSIGLWVGKDVSPNENSDAVTILNSMLKAKERNKFVLLSCPWCGIAMGPRNVAQNKCKCMGYRRDGNRVRFICDDSSCEFSDDAGLPVYVVDEDIYEFTPSLVIGTVDKFAMLPWRPRAGALFGINNRNSPPDLIIQDELHLISGPLGSMVGMYETLVDLLSMDNSGYRAKVVASTATISRAEEQIRALYGRGSSLFPPQALDAGESFFAFEDRSATGRQYTGVMATALPSHVTSQVRSISALLQSVTLAGADPHEMDAFWTLIGYFNSIRELGHMVTLLGADIREYMNVVSRRKLAYAVQGEKELRRYVNNHIELTSRVPSSQLPERLKQLFIEYDSNKPFRALDVCLATNMIQVGIDVPRLSLMAIIGQPKTTSEYIQASSRIGRDKLRPGLVIVNLNPSKPRDRSHFEHFRQYHQSIYKFVEPTSVTPFAVPVRERALHALVVSLARFWGDEELARSPAAGIPDQLKRRITDVILERVDATEPEERKGTRNSLDRVFYRWDHPAKTKYGDFSQTDEEPVPLMYPAGKKAYQSWEYRSFETPSSMRSVDSTCEAVIINHYPED